MEFKELRSILYSLFLFLLVVNLLMSFGGAWVSPGTVEITILSLFLFVVGLVLIDVFINILHESKPLNAMIFTTVSLFFILFFFGWVPRAYISKILLKFNILTNHVLIQIFVLLIISFFVGWIVGKIKSKKESSTSSIGWDNNISFS
jgi:hypothetical protein